jgi:hypothetical protein
MYMLLSLDECTLVFGRILGLKIGSFSAIKMFGCVGHHVHPRHRLLRHHRLLYRRTHQELEKVNDKKLCIFTVP